MSLPGTDVADSAISIDTGGGVSVPVTENVSQVITGTAGQSEYFFKIALPSAVLTGVDTAEGFDASSVEGGILASVALDGNFDAVITDLKKRFRLWKLKDMTIVLKCASPWSSASGTAQIAYDGDPENDFTGDDEGMAHAVRLAKSQQISAKSDTTMMIDNKELVDPVFGSDWRYCKTSIRSSPRMERFGNLVVMVRNAPANGDGSTWAVTLEGLAIFKNATSNSALTRVRYPLSIPNDDTALDLNYDNGVVSAVLQPTALRPELAERAGVVINSTNASFRFKIQSSTDPGRKESYTLSLATGRFVVSSTGKVTMIFPTIIGKRLQISDPALDTATFSLPLSTHLLWSVDEMIYQTAMGNLRSSEVAEYPLLNAPQSASRFLAFLRNNRLFNYVNKSADRIFHQIGDMLVDG